MIPQPVIEGLRALDRRVDLFTFTQRLADVKPRFSYPMIWDNLAAQPISTFDHWWTRQVDKKTRNMVRRANKKGIVTREVPFDGDLVEAIWRIYNETPVRQGKKYPHYGKSLQAVHDEEATHLESSVFIGAFLENEMIGFGKIVFDDSGTQAGLMNIISLVSKRDSAPTNALIAQAVRSSIAQKAAYLVYSRFSYGEKKEDSLSQFKKNNGFAKVLIPRYHVPLSTGGVLALRLGIHRGLADRIPEPIARRFRHVRRVCYGG